MVKNTPQNREDLEAGIAKNLDINVDNLNEACLSEQRLKQIFEKAATEKKAQQVGAKVLLAVLTASIAALIACTAVDDPDTAGTLYGAGFIGIICSIAGANAVFGDNDLKNEVTKEINSKTKQQNSGTKPPSPE